MYPKEMINEFKGDIKTNFQMWVESKIDALCAERPRLKYASVYLKRGLNNWMKKEEVRFDNMVDNILLFVTDENGCVSPEIFIQDLIKMFEGMDVQQAQLGSFLVEYGKGEIKIAIPHNPFLDIVFGELGEVKITSSDLMEIKDLFAKP